MSSCVCVCDRDGQNPTHIPENNPTKNNLAFPHTLWKPKKKKITKVNNKKKSLQPEWPEPPK